MPVPIVPPAPPRFSTTTGWPSWLDSGSSTSRPTISSELPAANGIIARIGRAGQACAKAPRERAGIASAAPANCRNWRRLVIVSLSIFFCWSAASCLRDRHLMDLHAERHGSVIAEQHQHLGDAGAADDFLDLGKLGIG